MDTNKPLGKGCFLLAMADGAMSRLTGLCRGWLIKYKIGLQCERDE